MAGKRVGIFPCMAMNGGVQARGKMPRLRLFFLVAPLVWVCIPRWEVL